MLFSVLFLLQLQLIIFRNQLFVPRKDVLKLRELIRVRVLHSLQKLLKLLHRPNFGLDLLSFGFVNFKKLQFVSDALVVFLDLPLFSPGELNILLFPHLLLLQESGELNKVVLDEDILCSQLGFLQFEFLLLPVSDQNKGVNINWFKLMSNIKYKTYSWNSFFWSSKAF